ncbi:PilW family protein [Tepidanaerobacter sp. GT38]|uniref:PilW family protein n=1 Tax=Tepidanaerobacter sp. GT38 TaxID=2722793 RepID=UPI001F470548|nr:prepilin-type N-terminal cleavage/methylation domain-containing protein [Tepidanaerobacter sp. GT38]
MLRTVATTKNSKGFTLIEIIVSLGLLSLILTATFAMVSIAEKAYKREDFRLYAQQNVRQAFLWLSSALRQARIVEVISENEIKITTAAGEQIIFYFQNGVLYRKRNAGTNPIAELSDLKFIQSTNDYIEMLLSVSVPFEKLTIKTKVTPFGTWIK